MKHICFREKKLLRNTDKLPFVFCYSLYMQHGKCTQYPVDIDGKNLKGLILTVGVGNSCSKITHSLRTQLLYGLETYICGIYTQAEHNGVGFEQIFAVSAKKARYHNGWDQECYPEQLISREMFGYCLKCYDMEYILVQEKYVAMKIYLLFEKIMWLLKTCFQWKVWILFEMLWYGIYSCSRKICSC